MQFVIIDESTNASPLHSKITPAWLANVAAALTVQLNRDLSPEWGGSYMVRAGANITDIIKGEIALAIIDSLPGDPGVIAYHTVDGTAVPYILLALTTCNTLDDVSTAMSHECCETAGDVACNLWADAGDGNEYANELCLAGDTLVQTLDGPVSIEDLTNKGVTQLTVSAADTSGKKVWTKALAPRVTHESAETVTVYMVDGTSVCCTPLHRILLEDGSFVEAGRLAAGSRLHANMGPTFARSGAIDSAKTNPQSFSANTSNLFREPKFSDLFLSQFSASVPRPPQVPVASHSPFGGSVQHIDFMGSQEQVCGVDTSRRVTRMANLEAREDLFGGMHLKRDPMGEMGLTVKPDLPIAGAILSPNPEPTSLTFDDPRPEYLFNRGRSGIVSAESCIDSAVPGHPRPMGSAHSTGPKRPCASFDSANLHDKVVHRVEPSGKKKVYDLTVPEFHNFEVGAGIYVHNCDAVESLHYTIANIAVSDFLLRAFFAPGSKGPYHYMATMGAWDLSGPFATGSGGYQMKRAVGSREVSINGHISPRLLPKKAHFSSRTYKRGAKV